MSYKILPFRLDEKMYNEIRDLAHINNMSKAKIIRIAIEKLLETNRNLLTNRDIAI